MSAARYVVGELVDLVIKGARVETVDERYVEVCYPTPDGTSFISAAPSPQVRFTRVAPPEWPPLPGDVWGDAHGGLWWAREVEGAVQLQSQKGGVDEADWTLGQYGPMRLEYRKGWTPAPIVEADPEPTQLDRRASIVAGLRELADLYEGGAMPLPPHNLPITSIAMNRYVDGVEDVGLSIEAMRGVAAALGVELVSNVVAKTGHRHWVARRHFGQVEASYSYVEYHPEDSTPPGTGDAPAADVAAEAAGAPVPEFELGKAGEHYMASGTKGDEPGDCGAECVCGVGFWGFDTLGEAVEHLDRHIANPDPRDTVDPFHVLPDGSSDNSLHSVPDADGDLIAPAGEA